MSWVINGDLDRAITLLRDDWERLTKKSISKKDMIMKLIYDNENTRKTLESNGIKIKKKLHKLPKL